MDRQWFFNGDDSSEFDEMSYLHLLAFTEKYTELEIKTFDYIFHVDINYINTKT